MASFYDDMALVTAELLSPQVFGQGVVILNRQSPGVMDLAQPWLPTAPGVVSETLKAAASGARKYADGVTGKQADGVTVLTTDLRIIAAVPEMEWRMAAGITMTVTVDGSTLQVMQTKGLPAAGTPAAIEIMARA